jgi:catechol 2,3-dioxygenase-like lactoylglutathione lyase family enzyme
MPRVIRVLETGLYVENVELTAKFYEDVFGFERMVSDDRFCAFAGAQGSVLLLFKRGGTTQPTAVPGGVLPPHDGSGQSHFAFSIERSELEPWVETLREKNVEIESRVTWPRGGESIYFRDPDQNLLELATPGVWPVF